MRHLIKWILYGDGTVTAEHNNDSIMVRVIFRNLYGYAWEYGISLNQFGADEPRRP
jgi:hypothetical protein